MTAQTASVIPQEEEEKEQMSVSVLSASVASFPSSSPSSSSSSVAPSAKRSIMVRRAGAAPSPSDASPQPLVTDSVHPRRARSPQRVIVKRRFTSTPSLSSSSSSPPSSSSSSDVVHEAVESTHSVGRFPPLVPAAHRYTLVDEATAVQRLHDRHQRRTTDHDKATHFSPSSSPSSSSPPPLPPPRPVSLPSVSLSLDRDRRVLDRVAALDRDFASFQSTLAARVSRPPASLCVTNAGEEHRMRMERAMCGDQERRIARESAALHSTTRLSGGGGSADEGGLPLPWEQSLRGAQSHSVQVGNMFSGLWATITQPEMKEMEIIRTKKQIRQEEQQQQQQQQQQREERWEGESGATAGQPRQPVRRVKGSKGTAGGVVESTSRAALLLVEEAARLEQIMRLAQLGTNNSGKRRTGREREQHSRRERAGEGADEEGDGEEQGAASQLRLSDLIVRGTSLFEGLHPPRPTTPQHDSRIKEEHGEGEGEAAVEGEDDAALSASPPLPPSLVLSCSWLSFSLPFHRGDVQSRHLTLHNDTDSTVHFEWTEIDSSTPSSSSSSFSSPSPFSCRPFLVSPAHPHVLPHSSLSLCVTFVPPSVGVYRQRLRLTQIDGGEEVDGQLDNNHSQQPLLLLEGVSRDATLVDEPSRAMEARHRVMAELHSTVNPVVRSMVSGWVEDTQVAPPSPSDHRALFTRANRADRLHFHPSLNSAWWALWAEVKESHRPLERAALHWDMSVAGLTRAIHSAPPRHAALVPHWLERLRHLTALSSVVPSCDSTRVEVLSSLLSSFARSLPLFARSLRSSLRLSESTPWELRAAAVERRRMEEEDRLGHLTIEQREAELNSAAQLALQQQTSTTSTTATTAVDSTSSISAEEDKVDAEWRELHGRYREEVVNEARLVVTGLLQHFAARAQPEDSEVPPTPQPHYSSSSSSTGLVVAVGADGGSEAEAPLASVVSPSCSEDVMSLPRPFRTVVIEVEAADVAVQDGKKGGKGKGKGGPVTPSAANKKK